MKILIRFYYFSALIILWFGCNNHTDAVKDAEKENSKMIDSQSAAQHIDSAAAAILPSKADADFLVDAASGGMLEVQLGELAQTHAGNQRVKNFGAMMIRDHGEGGEKLKALATSKNITLPDSVSNKQRKEKERLQQKNGAAFDEAYINMMVDDHKKDIDEFEKEATNGTNPGIKTFAGDNLRMLHVHLDSAMNIQKLVSPKKTSSTEITVPPY